MLENLNVLCCLVQCKANAPKILNLINENHEFFPILHLIILLNIKIIISR